MQYREFSAMADLSAKHNSKSFTPYKVVNFCAAINRKRTFNATIVIKK